MTTWRWVAPVLLTIFLSSVRAADEPTLSGRVVEIESTRPIAGVEVAAEFLATRNPERPAVEVTSKTDAEGRFRLAIGPEVAAQAGRKVRLRVRHPEYVGRISQVWPLGEILDGTGLGNPPLRDAITLEPGVPISAVVVRPDGSPAADVAFWFENWARSNPSKDFWNEDKGTTDAQGRIRTRTARTQSLALYLTPEDLAPYQHFWGVDQPAKHPDVWVPPDLGRIVLDPGVKLIGRVLDLKGQPIPGLRLEAVSRLGRDRRQTKADASGAFAFPPLRPGSYTLHAEGQGHGGYYDPTEGAVPEAAHTIVPRKVAFRRGEKPGPIELREAETVVVSTRFVDSSGRPSGGGPVVLSGQVPSEPAKAPGLDDPPGDGGLASSINGDFVADPSTQLDWGIQLEPDDQGRAVFRAPKGLLDASVHAYEVGLRDKATSLKTRLKPGGPLKYWGGGVLGVLDADVPGIEFVEYRAPTLLVTIVTEEGEPLPEEVNVSTRFTSNGFSYGGGRFVRQKDGRFRSERIMPDHGIEVIASGPREYLTARTDRISVPEGGSAELTLTLSKSPEAAKVGDPAPPFAFRTIDDKPLTLVDFAGKPVLLAFWNVHHGNRDIPKLKALYERLGKDGKLAIVGLSYDLHAEELAAYVKAEGLAWPQVRLGPQLDRIRAAYGVSHYPSAVLIGADGTILGKDLTAEELSKAVEALK